MGIHWMFSKEPAASQGQPEQAVPQVTNEGLSFSAGVFIAQQLVSSALSVAEGQVVRTHVKAKEGYRLNPNQILRGIDAELQIEQRHLDVTLCGSNGSFWAEATATRECCSKNLAAKASPVRRVMEALEAFDTLEAGNEHTRH